MLNKFVNYFEKWVLYKLFFFWFVNFECYLICFNKLVRLYCNNYVNELEK